MKANDYKKLVKANMSEYRYTHCLNVSKEAVRLAQKYGCDAQRAAVAGILHDITKEVSKDEQLQIMNDSGIILDDIQKNTPKLWHGISGSAYIKDKLKITDEDILNAVRYHTTGRANMTLLEKIIFIADFTSEERTYSGVDTMRKLAEKSLEEAMLFGLKFTLKDLSKREMTIHPDALACYNEIVMLKITIERK
ncbi:MAG: bis(5'-nucleosyl)-tetraphosphatase (symmetrical) YqeK [Clostridiales bacterium]|nr:bis(5'-nucleosyl)-tetraphosphatase (symmetrical) YqeK [Clostridiales bacterium]